jgi:hypothetical protein
MGWHEKLSNTVSFVIQDGIAILAVFYLYSSQTEHAGNAASFAYIVKFNYVQLCW